MPAFKRNYKRNYKKRNYRRKTTSLTTKVKKIETQLRHRRPELKSVITSALNQGLSITGAAVCLSEIGEGVTSITRIGLQIQVASIRLRYVLSHDGGANVSRARILLVRDKQQISDTQPTVSDVLRNVAISSVTQYSEVHKGRFEVLYDRMHEMDYYNRTGNGDIVLSLYGKGPSNYNGSASTDLQKNHYYLMWVSDQVTYVPAMTYSCMLKYTDC